VRACELKTLSAQSIIRLEVGGAAGGDDETAAAVPPQILRPLSSLLHPAATIFFNFPQQSSVDNKLMLSAAKLQLLLRLKQTANSAESRRVAELPS